MFEAVALLCTVAEAETAEKMLESAQKKGVDARKCRSLIWLVNQEVDEVEDLLNLVDVEEHKQKIA